MDRGERRRRDENTVRWMVKRYAEVCYQSVKRAHPGDRFYGLPEKLTTRLLGLKKYGVWQCHHCSKKRPGRPKVPRGACGLGKDDSPKIGRNRWRLDPSLWD